VEIESKSSDKKPFCNIVWGECFLKNGVFWFKAKDVSVRLSDGEVRNFKEDDLVTPVKARVTYEKV